MADHNELKLTAGGVVAGGSSSSLHQQPVCHNLHRRSLESDLNTIQQERVCVAQCSGLSLQCTPSGVAHSCAYAHSTLQSAQNSADCACVCSDQLTCNARQCTSAADVQLVQEQGQVPQKRSNRHTVYTAEAIRRASSISQRQGTYLLMPSDWQSQPIPQVMETEGADQIREPTLSSAHHGRTSLLQPAKRFSRLREPVFST